MMKLQPCLALLLVLLTAVAPLKGAGKSRSHRKISKRRLLPLPWGSRILTNQDANEDASSALKLSRSKLYRFQQRCQRDKLRRRRERISRQRERARSEMTPGSFLSITPPTPERVSRWFGSSSRSGRRNAPFCSTSAAADRIVFNHDTAGMTNPCIHVRNDHDQQQQAECVIEDDSSAAKSTTTSSGGWWPSCAWLEQQQQQQQGEQGDSSSAWRVLRYRRRVGVGSACYERAKEAALAWEFSEHNNKLGMLNVNQPIGDGDDYDDSRRRTMQLGQPGYTRVLLLPSTDNDEHVENDISTGRAGMNDHHHNPTSTSMIWSRGGRRLATFTRAPSTSGLIPRVFAVNPVAVVYDVVDQRGGPGGDTTFTSTAYATCKGHWFRGEERVTVALRRTSGQEPQQQPQIGVATSSSRRRGSRGDQQQQQPRVIFPSTAAAAAAPDEGGVVDVEILSISKPDESIMGRLTWAFSSRLQHRFFEAQLDALERQARQEQPPETKPNLP